jgi:hypothetical protein
MKYIIDTELGTMTALDAPAIGTIEAAVDALGDCYTVTSLTNILRRLAQAVAALEAKKPTLTDVFKWTGPPAMPSYPSIPSIPSPAPPFIPYIGDSNPLYPWTTTCQSQNPTSGSNSTPQADGTSESDSLFSLPEIDRFEGL